MSYIGAKNALRVPSGYTQLEYIQSTGTQYINTGISVPHASEKTIIEFAPMDVGYDNAIAGHAAPEWSWATNVSMVLNSNILVGNTTVPSVSLGVFCKFEYTKTYAKINDGASVTLQNLTYTDGYNNTLFYASTKYGKHKVKSYKLYNGSTLVRDLVPCKNPSGTVGMYDVVNGVFYGNAGTGVFTAGAEIPSGFVARATPKWYFGDSSKVARNIVKGYIGDASGLARLFFGTSGMPLADLPVGSLIRINENGAGVNYRLVHQGRPSSLYDYSCNGAWVLREAIHSNRVWDSSDTNYSNSDIHSWLNGSFLALFDSKTQAIIKQVKIPYRNGTSGASVASGANGLSTKIFLLGGYEAGWTTGTNGYYPVDGACLSYFSGLGQINAKRIANLNGNGAHWFLRSPYYRNANEMWGVTTAGGNGQYYSTGSCGIRPTMILDSATAMVNPTPNADGSYTLLV